MPPPFDGFIEHTKRVSPTCLIAFERNRYSVPAAFANHAVSLRVYAHRLVIVAEGSKVVEHPRLFSQGHDRTAQVLYDGRHYLAVVQRKPGALRNGAPFAELPDGFKRLQSTLLKRPGGDREMVEVLALVLHHDEQTVRTRLREVDHAERGAGEGAGEPQDRPHERGSTRPHRRRSDVRSGARQGARRSASDVAQRREVGGAMARESPGLCRRADEQAGERDHHGGRARGAGADLEHQARDRAAGPTADWRSVQVGDCRGAPGRQSRR